MVAPVDPSRLAARIASALRRRGAPEGGGVARLRASAAGRAARAEAAPADASSPLFAVLRRRVAALGGAGPARRRAAARLAVETLIGREVPPAWRAHPRFAGWIDEVVEALEAEPPWRAQLDGLLDRLLEEG
jgi:hypothetical protein